jgi:hypothetical protein
MKIEATFKDYKLVECHRCSELKTLVWNYPELAASMLVAHLITDGLAANHWLARK